MGLEGALFGTFPPPQNRTIRFAPPLAAFQLNFSYGLCLQASYAEVTPDISQSEIAATNFYDSGGSVGEELGEILGGIFVLHSLRPTKFLPNSSLLWLKSQNFIELLGLGALLNVHFRGYSPVYSLVV